MVIGGAPLLERSTTAHLTRWLARRVVQGGLTVFLVSFVVFVATQALPGNVATVVLGTRATPDRVHALREQLGLDRPLLSQFWSWFHGVLSGDLGTSLVNHESVATLLGGRIISSLILTATAMIFALPVALLAGMYAAYRRDKASDKTFLGASMVVNSLPDFVVGTLLIILFSTVVLHVLPPVSIVEPGTTALSNPQTLVLPAATLGVFAATYLGRLVRASYIDVLDSEYVQAARLRGLSTARIMFVHALPNAVAASIPAASIVAANTLAGVVVVEYLFGYPGVGSALVSAVSDHDIPVIQAVVLLMSTAFYLLNLLADVLSQLNSGEGRT
jgi:peptide/nickel transport system permease protein